MSAEIYQWDFKSKSILDIPVGAARRVIMENVCREFSCTPAGIRSKKKLRSLIDARCVFSYLTRKYLHDTVERIGMEQGRKDHSTIVHQLQKIEDFKFTKDPVIKRLENLEKKLLNN
jgi:chromosomal replication initiator protein